MSDDSDHDSVADVIEVQTVVKGRPVSVKCRKPSSRKHAIVKRKEHFPANIEQRAKEVVALRSQAFKLKRKAYVFRKTELLDNKKTMEEQLMTGLSRSIEHDKKQTVVGHDNS